MKNNLLNFIILIFTIFSFFNAHSLEEFSFDVSEIEIIDGGNKFVGSKRGTVKTNKGLEINADRFEYEKDLNILNASGNVQIFDNTNNLTIKTKKIIYHKNDEIILTEGDSSFFSSDDNFIINAKNFEYNQLLNSLTAYDNVVIDDKIENYKIITEKIIYLKNEEKIFTEGNTKALIRSKYELKSKNIIFFKNTLEIYSNDSTIISDYNNNLYKLSKFYYSINNEQLKGEKIIVTTNYNLPKSNSFYFSSAIINLQNQDFIAKDPEIKIYKDIFDNSENDPRVKGISSIKKGSITTIKKGIFTSCKETDDCPPWSIEANEIKHDKDKKQLIYENALLKIYDFPVIYFPKFFHPDPTVERQSGLLKPKINNSKILGNSVTLPYFKVISEDQDFTFTPTLFDKDIFMTHNEYRKVNKNSEFIADFGIVKGYKSNSSNKKKNITHLFANYNLDLDLDKFNSSNLDVSVERVSNDTYLKVYNSHITNSTVRPENFNILNNHVKLFLNTESYNFESGIETYENLQAIDTDRYQYVFPYYNFDTILNDNFLNGIVQFNSTGTNSLNNTNNLKSNIINDISYNSQNLITNNGFKNNFNVYLKNLNSVGKNVSSYKNSPQIELIGLIENNISYPLIKEDKISRNLFTPQASLRINPSDMKNYTDAEKKIDIGNIFSVNRLGLNDTLESGKSLTLGLNYSKEKKNLNDINKYFELKLATVFREKEQNNIPKRTTINRKTSNLFGSIKNNFNDNFSIGYDFALDNDYNKFEYNNFNATFSVNNFVTKFNFIEESGEIGGSNILENNLSYKLNENNFLTFDTRRNRKLNLTEYYNLVYEYKNDCLTAGVKYKKSYYEDRDLKPTEDLLFTITLYPLSSFEQDATGIIEN